MYSPEVARAKAQARATGQLYLPALLRTDKRLVLRAPLQGNPYGFEAQVKDRLPRFSQTVSGEWRAELTIANVSAARKVWPRVTISTGLGQWLAEAEANRSLDVYEAELENAGLDGETNYRSDSDAKGWFRVAEQKLGGYMIHEFRSRTQFQYWMRENDDKEQFVSLGSGRGMYRGTQDHRSE